MRSTFMRSNWNCTCFLLDPWWIVKGVLANLESLTYKDVTTDLNAIPKFFLQKNKKSLKITWNIKEVSEKRKRFGQWIYDLLLARIICSIPLTSVSKKLTVWDLIHMSLSQTFCHMTIWSHYTKAASLCTGR